MENKRKEWKRYTGRDNRGLSMVELICAIAIFSMVTAIIGTVIVVSARTYNRGISETSLQQEAQLAANRISTIVQDACEAKFEKNAVDGTSTLTLVTNEVVDTASNERKTYTIQHKEGQLLYSDGAVADVPLAEKIESFDVHNLGNTFDEEEFKNTRTLYLDMQVKNGDKMYNVNYAISARNEMTVDIPDGPAEIGASIFCDASVIMVPGEGEHYKIPISIAGKVTQGVEAGFLNEAGGLDAEKDGVRVTGCDMDGISVSVDKTIAVNHVILTVQTKDKYEGTITPKAKVSIVINIRRVRGINVTYTRDTGGVDPSKSDYSYEAEGAVYTFYANVTVDNPEKVIGASFEEAVEPTAETGRIGYQKPRQVEWKAELAYVTREGDTLDGAEITRTVFDSDVDIDGNKTTITYYEGDGAARVDYLKVEYKDDPNETVPKAVCTLLHDWASEMELTMTATSKHADGLNKASSDYDDVSGSAAIRARATKTNNLEVTMEPNETRSVALGSKGARPKKSDVTFKFYKEDGTTSYTPAAGTKAEYDPATDQVIITLGNDEAGSGMSGTMPYTFKVKVLVKGSTNESEITVHVRRVDYVHIDPVLNADDNATMDLRLRFNANVKDDNLIQYLIDGADKDAGGNLLNKALAIRITIEVLDKDGNPKTGLTQIAEWGTYESTSRDKNKENSDENIIKIIQGNWRNQLRVDQTTGNEISDSDYKNKDSAGYKNSKVVYQLENTKPARIYREGTTWKLGQTPELDIKPLSLGAGEKIKVTMEALHPAGMNVTGTEYKSDVKDIYILDGQEVINVAKQDIVVEPYQIKGSGNGAMEIPMHVAAVVGAVKVKLEGNVSEGTLRTKVAEGDYTVTSVGDNEWVIVKSNASSKEIDLMLDIAPTEEGRNYDGKDGRIKMTLEAYTSYKDSKWGDFLESTWAYLDVRRVTEVTIQDKNKFTNRTGESITLEALATGLQETEYFDRQVKESTDKFDPVWDQGDKYKDPYKLKWTLYYNGSEKEISNAYSEYFSNVKYGAVDKSGVQTITFTLTKELPAGAEIRAISVHAGDKSGKAENRSGLNYVQDSKYKTKYPEGIVYDYIKVNGGLIVADGFQRADDFDFVMASPFPNIRSYFEQSVYNSKQRTFFRYREAGTEWKADNKKYHMMDGEEQWQAKFSGNYGSRLFLPNKEYEVEIVNVVYGTGPQGQKVIYWPQDESLLEAGNGWAEEGYQLWDGSWGHTEWGQVKDENGNVVKDQWGNEKWDHIGKFKELYEQIKSIPQTPHNYLIPKTEVYFDKVDNVTETIEGRVKTIGSESAPRQIKNVTGTDSNGERHFAVKLAPTAFNIEKTQAHFTATIDKWENGKWTLMETLTQYHSLDESTYNWFMQVSVPKYDIYHVRPSASGKYRVRAIVTGMTWTRINPESGLFETDNNKKYISYPIDKIEVFDMSDDSGVMYLQLNE